MREYFQGGSGFSTDPLSVVSAVTDLFGVKNPFQGVINKLSPNKKQGKPIKDMSDEEFKSSISQRGFNPEWAKLSREEVENIFNATGGALNMSKSPMDALFQISDERRPTQEYTGPNSLARSLGFTEDFGDNFWWKDLDIPEGTPDSSTLFNPDGTLIEGADPFNPDGTLKDEVKEQLKSGNNKLLQALGSPKARNQTTGTSRQRQRR